MHVEPLDVPALHARLYVHAVWQATGTVIVDDRCRFEAMKKWEPAAISRQVNKMITAIAPAAEKVASFETAIRELFPE